MNNDHCYILKSLTLAMDKGVLVSLHSSPGNWSRCSVGYIKNLSETHVLLSAIDKYGINAGYELRAVKEVFRVDFGGAYEEALEHLNKNQQLVFNNTVIDVKGSDIFNELLACAKHERLFVTIVGQDKEDSLTGFVDAIDGCCVTLNVVDKYGKEDGVSIVDLNEISSIDCNTLQEQVLRFLYNNPPHCEGL